MAAIGILWGGPKCYRKKRFKDFMVFFEWFDEETMEVGRGEPTMVITRANRFALSGNRGSVLVPMGAAWKYADSKTGGPTRELVQFAAGACDELGLEPSKMNVFKVADAIVENVDELLRMPPEPSPDKFVSRKAKAIGEVTILDGGRVVGQSELH